MEKMTYDKLRNLEAKHQVHRHAKRRLKVYYGWSKINKIQKREAIAVAFENEEGAGWENSRSGKSLRKTMTVCYERYQTEKEMSDAAAYNRVFTVYYVFLDDKAVKGILSRALQINSESDKNHVTSSERKLISEALERSFMASHIGYKEPTRQLELQFK